MMRDVIFSIALMIPSVICTKITWTGNPDAPEASKVPRSQKYWDEHNVQRPDYAKTDSELAQERRMNAAPNGTPSNDDGGMSLTTMMLIILFFVALWVVIFKMGVDGMKGNKLGSSTNEGFSFSRQGKHGDGHSLEQKARLARLAKFDAKKET
jgi:hypothetical protein